MFFLIKIVSECSNFAKEIVEKNLSTYTLVAGSNTIYTMPSGSGLYIVIVTFRLNSGTFSQGVVVTPNDGLIQNNHDYGQVVCFASGGDAITAYNYGSALSLHVHSKIRWIKLR